MLWLFVIFLFVIFSFRIIRIRRKNRFLNDVKSSFRVHLIRTYPSKGERDDKNLKQLKKLNIHFIRMLWHFINRINQKKTIREILRKQIKVIDDEELVFGF